MEAENVRDYLFLGLYSLTCIVSLVGNGLVCKLVFFSAKMRTFTNILLASMAVSDFICGLTWPFRLLFCWKTFVTAYGPALCVVDKVVQLLTFQLSSVVMVIIAIDRCILFSSPFKRRHFSVWWLVGLSWLLSLIIIVGTSPSLAYQIYFSPGAMVTCGLSVVFDRADASPLIQRIRLLVANLAHFWIPFAVTTVCYIRICILGMWIIIFSSKYFS